jgi:CHAT domain-containing protein
MRIPILWLAMLLGSEPDPAAFVRELLAGEAARQCARLISSAVETKSFSGDQAIVDERHTSIVAGTLPDAIDRQTTSHSRITLKRTADGWQTAKRESVESETEAFAQFASETAVTLANQRRIDDAKAMAKLAVRVAERVGDLRSLAEALSARSVVARYETPPQHELAGELAAEAVAIAERAGDADTLARVLVRKARAAEDGGGTLDVSSLDRALALADRLENPAIAAHAAIHRSRSLEAGGRAREAFRYAALAWRFAQQSEDPAARISAALMLGGAYMWYGEHTIAIRYFLIARAQAETAGFGDVVASTYASVSNAQRFLKQNDEALRSLDEGLRRFPGREGVPLLQSRMGIHLTEGRVAEAERDLLRSIELEPRSATTERQIEALFAWLRLEQGDYEAAAAHAARSRGASVLIDRAATTTEAMALRCSGRPEEAVQRLEQLIESERDSDAAFIDPQRSAFAGSSNDEQDLLLELLVEQGKTLRALEISEIAKATRLRDALKRSDVDPQTLAGPAERQLEDRIRELNRALVAGAHSPAEAVRLLAQLDDARADLVDFRQRSFAARPALRARNPPAFRLDDLPASLDAITILSYIELESETQIFAIGPKQNGRRRVEVHVVPVGSEALQPKVQRLAEFIEQRNLRADALAEELYEILIAPVEDAVRGARSLCIIPDRNLWRVPFHALASRGGKPVLESAPVFYASSISVLAAAELRRQERSVERTHSLLAFANPTVASETAARYRVFDPVTALGALPEAETEVRAIAKIYGAEKSRVHIGSDARESTLKREAGRYDILHIASHGLVDESAPMFSSILLAAAGEEEDGLLEVREIVELNLDTELTVLSACDSGRSSGISGRGVMGLSWAFLAAGCPTTAVSLWSAQSAAASTMMIDFHRQLAKGLSRPAALRAAQLRLRRDPRYRHMFYWASFVIVGAP